MLTKPNNRSFWPTGSFRLFCTLFSLSFSCCISLNWSRYVLRMALVCRFRCSSASSYSRRLSRSILPETGNVSTVSRNVTPRRARRSGEESSSVDSDKKTRLYFNEVVTQKISATTSSEANRYLHVLKAKLYDFQHGQDHYYCFDFFEIDFLIVIWTTLAAVYWTNSRKFWETYDR